MAETIEPEPMAPALEPVEFPMADAEQVEPVQAPEPAQPAPVEPLEPVLEEARPEPPLPNAEGVDTAETALDGPEPEMQVAIDNEPHEQAPVTETEEAGPRIEPIEPSSAMVAETPTPEEAPGPGAASEDIQLRIAPTPEEDTPPLLPGPVHHLLAPPPPTDAPPPPEPPQAEPEPESITDAELDKLFAPPADPTPTEIIPDEPEAVDTVVESAEPVDSEMPPAEPSPAPPGPSPAPVVRALAPRMRVVRQPGLSNRLVEPIASIQPAAAIEPVPPMPLDEVTTELLLNWREARLRQDS
jgi:type VI secretion system secreted protein VgrG